MIESDSSADIRRWNRHKIDIRLKVTAAQEDGAKVTVFGRSNTISQGGMGAYILEFVQVPREIQQTIVKSCPGDDAAHV